MKNLLISVVVAVLANLTALAGESVIIPVSTNNVSLIFQTGNDSRLYQAYFGPKIDINGDRMFQHPSHVAYITSGTDNLFEPAIRVTHNDGNPSLELQYFSHQVEKPDYDIVITHIHLKDPQYPVEVTLHIKAFQKENVFEQWVEIIHREKKPVMLYNYASSMLHFDAEKYWLTQFHGDWAEEMKMQESELTSGIKILDTKLGTRAHMYQTPVFFLSLNGKSTENTGNLVAGTLEWSGNFRFLFELDERNSLRIISGINPFASEYALQPAIPFVTPSFIFTFSTKGKGEASRNMHEWARNYGVMNGNGSRLMLLNNWETTYFDFNEEKLKSLLDDTKKMGLDMFLLDDGWFANKYPRNNDLAGLGDWQENKVKLPNTLSTITDDAVKKNVKFGLWIEPEMVNPKSELYEKHPDWILKLPNRPEHYYRNQLVLDLTNPQVQDFVYGIVDGLLTRLPGIAYFKWDCNRMMTNTYSPYLKDKQSHVYVDYVNGLYSVLKRVRQKYPDLPMMLCSGGGARVDYGALRYFTEFWASDDTDPLERIYIQWGYSYFYPSVAVCNHITSWGKQSLKFKTDVAMMGKMGYDIPVNEMNEKELAFSQEAVKNYKRLSNVIWQGDLFRLISPYEENRCVLMYVNEQKDKAILFSYTMNARFNENFNTVKLQGLDPAMNYSIKEINQFPGMWGILPAPVVYSGEYLMNVGLSVTNSQPLTSAVLEITAQ
jgi:alpha-galactosidase